ncbi:hypothetical protein BCV71DRAFT_262362 [Rhizopus microsporus]|uniref:Uncharacterized protein n=1 Tax=Rhizopus microsporus TaxID=58291 RepID=A0A1X0S7I0_RHIZD|nr:hypothetical protein BCV71DRAFT_262362 [Rhizopus microsporus]
MERLVSADASLSRRRPDESIALTVGINVDLVHLGAFGKNAFDTYNNQNVMAIQAVGMNMTFYIMQRTTEELYTMFELEHIRCPSSTDEMTMMFGLMDKVMDIVQIFRTYCVTSPEQTSVVEVSKETLKYPILWAMTTATVSCKRKNPHEHTHF